MQLGGFPFRCVDTAGLRDAGEGIERLGIEVAMRYVDRADLVLLCVPAVDEWSAADGEFLERVAPTPVVLVETMADRAVGSGARPALDPLADRVAGRLAGRLRVSAVTGQGLDQLKQLLPELVYSAVVTAAAETPVVTRRRHAHGLRVARDELDAFRRALVAGLPVDVASTHLRPAETALEELVGVVSVDDVLDVVFREFCVGK